MNRESIANRLTIGCFLGLGCVAVLLLLNQALFLHMLDGQEKLVEAAQLASRQRVLSQKIVKDLSWLPQITGLEERQNFIKQVSEEVAFFGENHLQLLHLAEGLEIGDERLQDTAALFQDMGPWYSQMLSESRAILDLGFEVDAMNFGQFYGQLSLLVEAENNYLPILDQVVQHYENHQAQFLVEMRSWENFAALVMLLVLLLEGILIFRPIVRDIARSFEQLRDNNEKLIVENASITLEASTAKQAAQAKANFLATMSHEIRAPMNGVIGMTALLRDSPLNDDQQDYIETIRVSGETLLGIMNDISDLSKIEAGQLVLESHPFDVLLCVEESMQLMAPTAAEKGLELIVQTDPQFPREVVGDGTRLQQIFVNLLSNAVKFTHEGEIMVQLRSHRGEQNQVFLDITVSDTGVGVPEERRSTLFRSFFQGNFRKEELHGSSGLGLAICHQLITAMGGQIRVESEVGVGSSFIFSVMVGASERESLHVGPTADALVGVEILLADDNHTNQRVVSRLLEGWGATIHAVSSGKEALTLLRGGSAFHLALFDMKMPDMDGLELAEEARTLRVPEEMPIFLLSSTGNRVEVDPNLIQSVLGKPIRRDRLWRELSVALEARRESFSAEKTPKNRRSKSRSHQDKALKILLVDDNVVNLKVAKYILSGLGFDAELAESGRDAIQMVNGDNFDVVFMDVKMPGVSGLDAAREIRLFKSERRPWIVAMMTGNDAECRRQTAEAGMNDFFQKPVTPQNIKEALERMNQEEADLPRLVALEVG